MTRLDCAAGKLDAVAGAELGRARDVNDLHCRLKTRQLAVIDPGSVWMSRTGFARPPDDRSDDAEDETVAASIRRRRLEHCRQDLLDSNRPDRPVSAVGARWGFPDATAFSRAFRAAYGLPPGEYRTIYQTADQLQAS